METILNTPQEAFLQPRRLMVPLFQRPYVWSRASQWEPLWDDVIRQANKISKAGGQPVARHFLGAVVLQHASVPFGNLPESMIIDGQQRLTTLQVMFDAVHAAVSEVGSSTAAAQLANVIENGPEYRKQPIDKFKLWPTNRDQAGFAEVMSAETPVNYPALKNRGDRLVEAHAYFYRAADHHLKSDPDNVHARARDLVTAMLHGLQLVVITLGADENAQEIFETLNARMTPLTSADLIKNLVFQNIVAEGGDSQELYEKYWAPLESPFWESVVTAGRLKHQRLSLFFNHWLIATTGNEVVSADVFRGFKRYLEDDSSQTKVALLEGIHAQAKTYESFILAADDQLDSSPLALFVYRTQAIDIDTVKPLLLWLLDPQQEACPPDQIEKALAALESWLIRRTLMRVTTQNYNRLFADLLSRLRTEGRDSPGDVIEEFLREQTLETSYWPGDAQLREFLRSEPMYGLVRQERIRVVLEAVEDHLRGFTTNHARTAEHRLPRGGWAIEHVMPQNFERWGLDGTDAEERALAVQRLGNLTLLPKRFNSSVSNSPWLGPDGKREAFRQHLITHLNQELAERSTWDEAAIEQRSNDLASAIIATWPVPKGHVGSVSAKTSRAGGFKLATLIADGFLTAGQALIARGQATHQHATVLADGRLEVAGVSYTSPSAAAKAAKESKAATNGWWFWLVDAESRTSLADGYEEFLSARATQTDGAIVEP